MIKFTGMADEHTVIPSRLVGRNDVYCTYAWVVTDEISEKEEKFPITVIPYKLKRYNGRYVFSERVWRFMEDDTYRNSEIDKFIEQNLDKLNDLFIEFAKSQGYLK